MVQIENILKAIYEIIDEKNAEFPDHQQLEKSAKTALFGENAKLDSLSLVSCVVATEQKISEDFNTLIALTDDRALSQARSPFRTVQTLAEYIKALLDEDTDGKS